MNPDQFNQNQGPYPDPYSPGPPTPQPTPSADFFQPPTQPYGTPTVQPQYGQPPVPPTPQPTINPYNIPPQPSYGPQPQTPPPNPYASPGAPNPIQQAPLQPVQSPMMGYNPYPYPEEFTARKAGPNKLVFGIVAVLVIVGVLFTILAMSDGGGETPPQGTENQTNNNTQNTNAGSDIVPRTDGKLDLSSKINVNKNLKAQNLQGSMNEQVNLSSGFSFMATNVASYTPTSTSIMPATGKQFIAVTVIVGNRTDSNNLSVSYLDFRLRGQDSTLIAGHAATNEITNNALASPVELKPGEQISGKIVFEVDSTTSSWALQHTETYQKTTDNSTFDVKGEVGLALLRSSTPSNNSNTN